jgi:hypothetical protein
MRTMLLIATALATAAGPAAAATFDFEALALGGIPGDTLVLTDGAQTATFTGLGLQIRTLSASFNAIYGTRYLSTLFDSEEISVTFSQTVDLVTIVNPINGSVSGEIDTIFVSAFDSGGNLLGTTTSSADSINIAFPGIVRVTFDDPLGTGYVLASLTTREADVVVPAPAALALFGLGLAALGLRRRV